MIASLVNQNTSILYGKHYLHSLRNPQREADRIIGAQLLDSGIQKRISRNRPVEFFVINPGIAYAARSVLKFYPLANITAIYTDPSLYSLLCKADLPFFRRIHCRCISNYASLSRYVDDQISGLKILNIQLIDWKPSRIVAGHSEILQAFRAIIESKYREILTQLYFGKTWIRNIMKNTRRLRSMRHLKRITGPVFLCASGTSLLQAIPIIQKFRSKVHLWALASSTRALSHKNLIPNCVISSDGGYWAQVHLRHLPKLSHVLLALNARVSPSQLDSMQSFEFFSPDIPILKKTQSMQSLPDGASVLFSALNFIKKISIDPVIVFAADFTTGMYQSHARPNAFDEYIESQGSRVRPLSSNKFIRSNAPQLRHYADWFNASQFHNPSRVFRWRASGIPLSVPELSSEGEIEEIINSSAKIESEWELGQHNCNTIFKNDIYPIPNTLFSDESNKAVIESLLYIDGLSIKKYYLKWLSGESEAKCIEEFKVQHSPICL